MYEKDKIKETCIISESCRHNSGKSNPQRSRREAAWKQFILLDSEKQNGANYLEFRSLISVVRIFSSWICLAILCRTLVFSNM